MNASASSESHRIEASPPLLSHNTILILSGILIGMPTGNLVEGHAKPIVYLAGILGVVAYFTFRRMALHRQRVAEQAAIEQTVSQIEQRISRHLPAKPSCLKKPPHTAGVWSLAEIESEYRSILSTRH